MKQFWTKVFRITFKTVAFTLGCLFGSWLFSLIMKQIGR